MKININNLCFANKVYNLAKVKITADRDGRA